MPPVGNSTTPASEDMYGDNPDADAAPAADEKEDEGGETAVLPKSLCPGMKPGDELTLKIDSVQEDQYVVSYPGKESSKEKAEAPQGDAEMVSMME